MEVDRLERTLGLAVRQLRVSQQLTREEVAARANVSLGALRNLETGSGSTISTLVRTVHALGADEWLTQLSPAPEPFSPLAVVEAARHQRARPPQRVRARRS